MTEATFAMMEPDSGAPPTVPLARLLEDPRLALATVLAPPAQTRVRWAHSIELLDPAPYLTGGELVMTTGLRLGEGMPAAEVEAYVASLVGAGVTAVAFGVGVTHATTPAALVEACRRQALPLLEVPLRTPFLAVAQAVADLLAEQRARTARRVQHAQRELTRAATRGGYRAVVATLARQLGAEVALTDADGRTRSRAGSSVGAAPLAVPRSLAPGAHHVEDDDGVTETQPVGEHAGRDWLAVRRRRRFGVDDRALVAHAVALLTLLLEATSPRSDAVEAVLVALVTGDEPTAAEVRRAGLGGRCVPRWHSCQRWPVRERRRPRVPMLHGRWCVTTPVRSRWWRRRSGRRRWWAICWARRRALGPG